MGALFIIDATATTESGAAVLCFDFAWVVESRSGGSGAAGKTGHASEEARWSSDRPVRSWYSDRYCEWWRFPPVRLRVKATDEATECACPELDVVPHTKSDDAIVWSCLAAVASGLSSSCLEFSLLELPLKTNRLHNSFGLLSEPAVYVNNQPLFQFDISALAIDAV
jgi:hypothetical protein